MNTDIINLVSNLDGEESRGSRRELFANLTRHSGKIALAAATPFVAAGCAAIGQAVAPDRELAVKTLQFALLLEELEHAFYVQALAANGLIPASDRPIFEQISKHEGAHVTFLTTGITGIGGKAEPAPEFDFTGRGKYPGVFRNYRTFLELSQTFEDLGVKAYKGQAANLITSNSLLTAALRIHSVEARHAAEVRRLRGVKPWDGAFDEPLSKEQVLAQTSPFVRNTTASSAANPS